MRGKDFSRLISEWETCSRSCSIWKPLLDFAWALFASRLAAWRLSSLRELCFFSHANKYCNVRKSLSYKISSTTWILISHCAMLWAYPCTVLNIGAVWKHLYLHGWKNSLKMWSVFLKDVQVRESILQIPQPCFEVNVWSPSVAHKAPEFRGGCCKVSNSPALAARDEGSQPLCCLCVSVFQHSEHRQVLN